MYCLRCSSDADHSHVAVGKHLAGVNGTFCRTDESRHTAVGILVDISRFSVDDSLYQLFQVFILAEQGV